MRGGVSRVLSPGAAATLLRGKGRRATNTALDRTHALCLMRVYNRFHRPLQNIAGQKYALKVLGVFEHEIMVADQRLTDRDRLRVEAAVNEYRSWLE